MSSEQVSTEEMKSESGLVVCYDLYLNVPSQHHVVIDGDFSEVAGSRVFDAEIKGVVLGFIYWGDTRTISTPPWM